MVAAASAMLVFASLDVAFHLRHNLYAFTIYEGEPGDEFSKVSNWISVGSMACYVAQTFVGDSILVRNLPLPYVGHALNLVHSYIGVGLSGVGVGWLSYCPEFFGWLVPVR